MANTLVLQSHRTPLPAHWLADCTATVQEWASFQRFDYLFLGDELFDSLSPDILAKTAHQKVIATDLARLKAVQDLLQQGYQTVVWCDADFLVFDPANFTVPDSPYSLGREVWVQPKSVEQPLRFKAYVKVHNAFMTYRRGNSFLDFYADTAERLLRQTTGPMPPQFIGPKLLTALHNVVQCPVAERAGMLSPSVIKDLLAGGGPALRLFHTKSPEQLAGANLCSSMLEAGELSDDEMAEVIRVLKSPSGLLQTSG